MWQHSWDSLHENWFLHSASFLCPLLPMLFGRKVVLTLMPFCFSFLPQYRYYLKFFYIGNQNFLLSLVFDKIIKTIIISWILYTCFITITAALIVHIIWISIIGSSNHWFLCLFGIQLSLVCTCTCVNMNVCLCTCMCMYTYVCKYAQVNMFVCAHLCTCV